MKDSGLMWPLFKKHEDPERMSLTEGVAGR